MAKHDPKLQVAAARIVSIANARGQWTTQGIERWRYVGCQAISTQSFRFLTYPSRLLRSHRPRVPQVVKWIHSPQPTSLQEPIHATITRPTGQCVHDIRRDASARGIPPFRSILASHGTDAAASLRKIAVGYGRPRNLARPQLKSVVDIFLDFIAREGAGLPLKTFDYEYRMKELKSARQLESVEAELNSPDREHVGWVWDEKCDERQKLFSDKGWYTMNE